VLTSASLTITLEVSTSGVDKAKESETSRQLTEDVITKLDSDIIDQEQHRLHTTTNQPLTESNHQLQHARNDFLDYSDRRISDTISTDVLTGQQTTAQSNLKLL